MALNIRQKRDCEGACLGYDAYTLPNSRVSAN